MNGPSQRIAMRIRQTTWIAHSAAHLKLHYAPALGNHRLPSGQNMAWQYQANQLLQPLNAQIEISRKFLQWRKFTE
jgi:hypothetical protein